MAEAMTPDFSGWATKNDLRCTDGRIIRKGAFAHCDGKKVPLVWMHQHEGIENTLGHAILHNRDEGVYADCYLNESENGKLARIAVQHGDIDSLSIYANHLQPRRSKEVQHGDIQELSLVLAGANPGASIDNIMVHGEMIDDEAIIWGMGSLIHGDEEESEEVDHTSEDDEDTDSEESEVNEEEDDTMAHSDTDGEKTVQDVIDSMNEEQKNVLNYLLGKALSDSSAEHSDEDEDDDDNNDEENEEDETMKHNAFDEEEVMEQEEVLSHDDIAEIISDGPRYGSLKRSFEEHTKDRDVLVHSADYGIEHIDYLFPDHKNVGGMPEWIKRDTGWVPKVMGRVHHTPFSRIKTMQADITADEARAKGYTKGHKKTEEVFTLLKRTTDPTTVYKKQKLDRDDMIDITDFNVVSWLKSEMRMMLDEELARAVLIGDGRSGVAEDKIKEDHIRPIWTDDELYTIHKFMTKDAKATADEKARDFIRTVIKARKDYKGSGNPTLFTTEDIITDCLLLEDTTGRILYDSVAKLATTLRVSEIVTVPVMEGATRTATAQEKGKVYLMGLIVNMHDYNIGADKGGEVNMFDDFDIDYNQMKYLMETRCSGALIKAKSAISIEMEDTISPAEASENA